MPMCGLMDDYVVPHEVLTACRTHLSQSGVRCRLGLTHSLAIQRNDPKATTRSSIAEKPIHSLLVAKATLPTNTMAKELAKAMAPGSEMYPSMMTNSRSMGPMPYRASMCQPVRNLQWFSAKTSAHMAQNTTAQAGTWAGAPDPDDCMKTTTTT